MAWRHGPRIEAAYRELFTPSFATRKLKVLSSIGAEFPGYAVETIQRGLGRGLEGRTPTIVGW
jgi:hypothetical protein